MIFRSDFGQFLANDNFWLRVVEMPLNGTQSQQVRRAAKELAAKQQLEAKFSSELNRLFRRIGADLNKSLANTGGTVSVGTYANDLRIILDRNYKRVQKAFVNEIVLFLQQNRANLDEKLIRELTAIAQARGTTLNKLISQMKTSVTQDLNSFREFNVGQSVAIITDTTQREIDRAVQKANQQLIAELGEEPTNGQLARQSRTNFVNRQVARANMIAATETQKVAEGTKQIERDNLLALRNNSTATQLDLEPLQAEEIWVTQGDSLVRDGDGNGFNHLAADGQEKVNGAFTVSNQLLRFPGDISLGASAGNVINCRCSAVTVIN